MRHGPVSPRFALSFAVIALAAAGTSILACSDDGAGPGGDLPLPGRSQNEDGGEAGPAPPTDARPPAYVDFAINHVLLVGQSNVVGNSAAPELSTAQPFENLMFDNGPMSMTGGYAQISNPASAPTPNCDQDGCRLYQTPTKFVPLVEGDRYFDYTVETPASGLANGATYLGGLRFGIPKHTVLASVDGRSGNSYYCVRKGGCVYHPGYLEAFDQGLKEVASAKALAAAAGKSYVVRAVAAVHGEADHALDTQPPVPTHSEFPLPGTDGSGPVTDYGRALEEWQRDYETGIKAITQQTLPVPLLVSQLSGWRNVPGSPIAQLQLDAHVRSAGKVMLVGPTYALPVDADCTHFSNQGERRLGEYFAKAYAHVVFTGQPWEPLRPKTVTLTGNVIRITFVVPKPPLVIDTSQVAAAPNHGFTFTDDSGGSPPITGVEIAAADTVQITLASAPIGGNKRIAYAMNQPSNACISTPSGARGNLRDSDDTPSRHGYTLQNWTVHFTLPIP
jgi:hypothetical protein